MTVRMDQGISYWRAATISNARKVATWFDFTKANIDDQVKSVVEMSLPIEGGALPTELFIKVRSN